MVFRKYYPHDLWYVLNRDTVAKLGFSTEDNVDSHTNWTAISGRRILGCGGFRKFWRGVYECWLAAEYKDFYLHKYQAIHFIQRKLDEFNAHRLQATIIESSPRDIHFAEVLGFSYEGHLRKYGPDGQTYVMYSLVK